MALNRIMRTAGRRMAMSPLMTATGQVGTATVMLTFLAILGDGPRRLALISTAFADILFFRVLGSAG